jgi:Restriction endonuclease S subunits
LGDVGTFRTGGTPPRSNPEFFQGNIPWITTVALGKRVIDETDAIEFISEEALKKSSTKLIKAKSIMIGIRVGVGKTSINAVDMATNQDIVSIEDINEETFYKPYLMYFLNSCSKLFSSKKRGATIQGIITDDLKNLMVPIPPMDVQIIISSSLDSISELLYLQKQQLDELDQLIKSVFYEMFGDPVANEKGWEIKSIGSVFQVETGATPSRGNYKYYEDATIPWVKTGEIEQGYIFNTDEMISQLAIQETNCKLFPQNTVLIAMYGQGKTRGRAGLLKISAATNQACAAILPSESFNAEFLYRYLSINYETLRALGRGGNQENLNLSMIRDFKLISPPLSMQNNFTDIVSQIESQKSLVKQSIDETQRLFDSLMSKYFDD